MVLVVSSETAQGWGVEGWGGLEKQQQTTRKGRKQVEDEGNVICQSQLRNSMQLLVKKNMHGWNNAKKLVR